ncbi:UNVERIFIED_CONTAM: hypothetical protein GTU68_059509, partial [Idotea baltica]|nr:hypothetical protein [Idotea baltica]
MTVNMSMDDTEDRWWEQTELTRLYLSSNSLSSIDPLISNLSALQLLDLSDNRLTTLPEEMKELKGLTKLQLSHKELRDL